MVKVVTFYCEYKPPACYQNGNVLIVIFFAGCCSHSAVTVFSFTCGTCLPAYS